ncbi:MAG: hypothetical protein J6N49_03470 [Alphaproteobacteria bacterium]|nr:hypothetical protein [Alphaproteobacteria bacterium]
MDKFDEIFAKVQQSDEQTHQQHEQRIKEARQKLQEEERRKQESARMKEMYKAFFEAVKKDDIEQVKQCFDNGVSLDFTKERYSYGHPYAACQDVSSPEMAELILKNIDLSNKDAHNFAELMFASAINKDHAQVAELIAVAKRHDISLDPAMHKVKELSTMEQLARAGVDIQHADFREKFSDFNRFQNGTWAGRDGDIWVDPQPERAEQLKKDLLPMVDKAAKLGYQFLQKDNDNLYVRSYAFMFLASLSPEKDSISSSALRLQAAEARKQQDEYIKQQQAEEAERQRIQAAEEAKKQREEEARRQKREQEEKHWRLQYDFREAVAKNNVSKARDLLKQGADISYLNEDPKKYGSARDLSELVRTPEMAEFLYKQLDLTQDNHRKFAEQMLAYAITADNAPIDRLIGFAQRHNIALEPAMCEASEHPYTALNVYEKLTKAGVEPKVFRFADLTNTYYKRKNGYWQPGRDDDYWRGPQPENAAKIKKTLTEILKQGYPFEFGDEGACYKFAKELTYENRYKKMSDADKKMIDDLKNDNVDDIRQALQEGRLKDEIVEYMRYVPSDEQKGEFFKHYIKMLSEYEKEHNEPAASLEQAEMAYIDKHHSFYDLAAIAPFKPAGMREAIGPAYVNDCFAYGNSSIDTVRQFPAEYREAIGMHLASRVDQIMKRRDGYHSEEISALRTLSECYSVCEGVGKEALRVSLLKYRSSGTNEERREKAGKFEEALKKSNLTKKEKNDQTMKAVSQVSYTPMSSLNSQLRKYKKELEK